MKKTALLVLVIVAMAMMIGAQSALAAKPAPVTGIANGRVIRVHFSGFGVTPEQDGRGPWSLVFHTNQGTVNFNATCKTSTGVVKVSAIGPAELTIMAGVARITGPGGDPLAFSAKSGGVMYTYYGKIEVSSTNLVVDFGHLTWSGIPNIKGNVRLRKWAP